VPYSAVINQSWSLPEEHYNIFLSLPLDLHEPKLCSLLLVEAEIVSGILFLPVIIKDSWA
jgi:hypothetical protein